MSASCRIIIVRRSEVDEFVDSSHEAETANRAVVEDRGVVFDMESLERRDEVGPDIRASGSVTQSWQSSSLRTCRCAILLASRSRYALKSSKGIFFFFCEAGFRNGC